MFYSYILLIHKKTNRSSTSNILPFCIREYSSGHVTTLFLNPKNQFVDIFTKELLRGHLEFVFQTWII